MYINIPNNYHLEYGHPLGFGDISHKNINGTNNNGTLYTLIG